MLEQVALLSGIVLGGKTVESWVTDQGLLKVVADEELMLEMAKNEAWRLPYLRTNQRQWDGGDAYNAWQKLQGKKGEIHK